ncbi:MAG: HPP family protein [Comamonas sp.]
MQLGSWGNGWKPAVAPAARLDVLRVGLGAGLGLALAAALVQLALWAGWQGSWTLFAPLGATAVLVFAVHTGPLSQPWSCVVGNTVAALWAWLVVMAWPSQAPAWLLPAVAVAGAIACMQLTRSLHPPGGAVALLLALEAQHGVHHGWSYAFMPIGLLTLLLVLLGVAYHRAWGKHYPLQVAAPTPAAKAQHLPADDLSNADLQALLARFDQDYNLTAQELGQLVRAAEEQAIARRFGSVRCGQVMSAKLWTCGPRDGLGQLAAQFQQHPIKSLPVLDGQGRLLGVVARGALFDWLWQQQQPDADARRRLRTWRLWGKKPALPAATPTGPTCAADLMQPAPLTVQDDTPVSELLETLAMHTVPFVAVLRQGQLAGLITRTDIMRILLH